MERQALLPPNLSNGIASITKTYFLVEIGKLDSSAHCSLTQTNKQTKSAGLHVFHWGTQNPPWLFKDKTTIRFQYQMHCYAVKGYSQEWEGG